MRILCDRRHLLDTVGIVTPAVAAKSPKPILQNILLSAASDRLSAFATDLEIAIASRIHQVKVEEDGDCLVPAREFSALLRELTDPTVTLHSDERRCRVETAKGSFQLLGADVGQYPAGFVRPEMEPLRLPAAAFVDLVRRTAFAVAKESTRFAMNGVLCQATAESFRMVGTDGRRLSLAYRTFPEPRRKPAGSKPDLSVIVPAKALQSVVQSLALHDPGTADPGAGEADETPAQEIVEIRSGASHIAFSSGPTEVFARLIDGEFPQFESVIPKTAETTVEIERQKLESLVRMVAIFQQSETHAVRCTLEGGELKLDSELANVGSADVRADVEMKGPGGQALYNPEYLLDFLKITPAETVRFEFTDENSPAKFVPEEQFIYVIMPITGS